ncbi:MAG: hypothetical protein ACE5GJ_00525 [Gemmatimonadota bacterium]
MTLSPVFRSPAAVQLLKDQGMWRRLAPDMEAQADAVRMIYADLRQIIGPQFLAPEPHVPGASEVETPEALHFLQEYFFLILFRAIFGTLGVSQERLRLYTELNFCIKGTITAADNLFDDQDKSLLPLADTSGPRFRAILQLMCFERLSRRTLERAEHVHVVNGAQRDAILRGLLDRMASIGLLEGSEEGGVDDIPEPGEMVERVHRVRGGALFALAFVAPSVLEGEGPRAEMLERAEEAISRLGTAFQIVDDLTDFEFDLGRRSHNLLVSRIHHHGAPEERELLARLREGGEAGEGVVERGFAASARAVLEMAYAEAEASFGALEELGFWVRPEMAREVVHAIVGLDGVARMESLTSTG